MQEAEARTKWCPFASQMPTTEAGEVIPFYPAYSRHGAGLGPADPKCVGSGCMAWRWRRQSESDGACGLARAGDLLDQSP